MLMPYFSRTPGVHRPRLPVPEALWRVGGHGEIGSGRQRSGAVRRSLEIRQSRRQLADWRTSRRQWNARNATTSQAFDFLRGIHRPGSAAGSRAVERHPYFNGL